MHAFKNSSFAGFGKLFKLSRLKEINLSFNLFNNNILTNFSGFSNLKSLYLKGNQLKGSIHIKGRTNITLKQ